MDPIPYPEVQSTVAEQQQNEDLYCTLLAQGILAVLLPPEDYGNACLRTLVTDVLGELILENSIGRKICEGPFIWESITKLAEMVKAQLEPKATGEEIEKDTRSRLEKFGLISTKNDIDVGKPIQQSTIRSSASSLFWRILQYIYLAFIAIRFITLGLYMAISLPASANPGSRWTKPGESADSESARGSKRPIVTMRIWSLASHLADLTDRMPWLAGLLSFLQYQLLTGFGRIGATDGVLDK